MCGQSPCDKPNCTWGEKYRKECEAREVMSWDRVKRSEYYADVKKRRGEAAVQELIEEVKKQWNANQQPFLL
ncbi:MAG: hypothetical protein BWY57_02136 [Betaproteobacteria bacterium ADurb.Bin341]|nr:MAG: hypothetical protein BWY57_02136 [Betaproteobacteria bacterium ADurb.Bin341]